MSIWLADGDNHHHVENALVRLLDEAGFEIVYTDDPEWGSWYRRFKARLKRANGASSHEELMDELARRVCQFRTVPLMEIVDFLSLFGGSQLVSAADSLVWDR